MSGIVRSIGFLHVSTGNWAYWAYSSCISIRHLSVPILVKGIASWPVESFPFDSPKATFQTHPCLSFHPDFGKRNDIEWPVFPSELFWTAHQADLTQEAIS